MHGKQPNRAKPVQMGGPMYRKRQREQVEFENFHLAFGGKLRSDNRWVRLAKLIPWEDDREALREAL